tara:strand:+ start:1940 stop:2974 length:1035 start_codon:yes stop_codon:yes gene_type:complete
MMNTIIKEKKMLNEIKKNKFLYLGLLTIGLIGIIFTILNTEDKFDPKKKTIEIIVPYPAGGATDKIGRMVSEMFEENGWKSIVVNKPGANTTIGSNYVSKAKANGNTLYIGGNGFLDANIAFKEKAPGIQYKKDSFTPIAPLGIGTLVLAVTNTSEVNDYEGFKTYVKNNPDKFKVGFWNSYTGKIFKEWARQEGLPVPTIVTYKGSSPQIADILGGHIEFIFDTFTATNQHYADKKIKIIATLDQYGVNKLKEINSESIAVNIAEKFPDLEINIWYGVFAPKGMDIKVVNLMNKIINESLKQSKYQDSFKKFGIFDVGGSPEKLKNRYTSLYNTFKQASQYIE